MIDIIRSDDRGAADHGWLQSRHTFSFADYYNPKMMGFAKLRVVNEDWIEPGQGFGTHPHQDMEIVTYMIDGALEHKDSMGNGSVIRPGELQRMTAGTGVFHSEFNHSNEEQAHLLQIWILPERNGLEPGYEQKLFPSEEKRSRWRLVGSRDGREGSLTIHQDVNLLASELEQGEEISYDFDGRRRGFMQVVRGAIEVDGETLEAGDALATQDQESFAVRAKNPAELLLFDMA
ncbi:MAG: pirin family protein [Woeseiaceae bacterium]|nr:pirin family protein [Woeseiaceae bacterium]NIP21940.1 pirin family protein [Woeseiaceae bacterium]NIS91025.1 pirin family protein [Woeseiaceae bacterium]